MNKYCEGIDCAICNEKEPCIYKIANELEKKLQKIKTYAKNTLNMVDYRTYFKRDNKSIKQEAFKALFIILQIIEE